MDVVMDLSARAVAFITLTQDMVHLANPQERNVAEEKAVLFRYHPAVLMERLEQVRNQSYFQERILELRKPGDPYPPTLSFLAQLQVGLLELKEEMGKKEDSEQVFPFAFKACLHTVEALLHWLQEHQAALHEHLFYYHFPSEHLPADSSAREEKDAAEAQPDSTGYRVMDPYPAPQQWREALRFVLYAFPQARVGLAQAINYLPALVKIARLTQKDTYIPVLAWQRFREQWSSDEEALKLLVDDDFLFGQLQEKKVPLPFEMIFCQELKEIRKRRSGPASRRAAKTGMGFGPGPGPAADSGAGNEGGLAREANSASSRAGALSANPQEIFQADGQGQNPIRQAQDLGLRALAFSGGGIRSACFNLGILQGLAKADLLPGFDYLSTVSGGGYLGSWFAAWVKRDGHLLKVQDRLNPEKSADPKGEEVRPIRWLRMFSNYLAPNASIMSTDSWTMGLTWVRNTMLNQFIILLLLCVPVSVGMLLFLGWERLPWGQISHTVVLACSSVLLLAGGVLAGWGMEAYSPRSESMVPHRLLPVALITGGLVGLGLLLSFLVSSWFFIKGHAVAYPSFYQKLTFLLPVALVGGLSLLLVAWLGNYASNLPVNKKNKKTVPALLMIVFSLVAAAFGWLLLALAWDWIQYLASLVHRTASWEALPENFSFQQLLQTKEFNQRLAFILGVPLILEVLSLTVIMRMALLGKYFPDARREWWGRIGAWVHRGMLAWVLLGSLALLGAKLWAYAGDQVMALTGGWVVLVGTAVRLAYSAGTPAQENAPKSMTVTLKDVLVRLAPYLFIVGIFIIGAKITNWIMANPLTGHAAFAPEWVFLATVMMIFLTWFLAWRVGVNEFSMHHFYKNRLMRGFLAATRRRSEREETANPFTGFDEQDDLKLYLLRQQEGYNGPYPIINTTLNASQVTNLDRQDRKGESFVFTPLFCGFDISLTGAASDRKSHSLEYGYRPTELYAYKPKILPDGKQELQGPTLSTAMAISGAAANPNQGAHSSPATAFLMTVFNARLGWWMGNPRGKEWQNADPQSGLAYLIYDLLGTTDISKDYVCLSDGGHFDNMGLYELVRRQVRLIVLGDGEQDSKFACEGLANAVRRCRVDFGVEISIDVNKITNRDEKTRHSDCHYALGTIWYPNDPAGKPSGRLIYLKSSLTGDEPVDVREYALENKEFPHQSTSDQFFSEAQFESYRRLGLHILDKALAAPGIKDFLLPPT